MERKLEILLAISFDFSIEIILLCKKLIEEKQVFFTKPLFQCTSKMGICINEAVEFQNNRTFLSKLSVASGEAKETLYWLKRIEKDKLIQIELHSCIEHCEQILKQINSATYA